MHSAAGVGRKGEGQDEAKTEDDRRTSGRHAEELGFGRVVAG